MWAFRENKKALRSQGCFSEERDKPDQRMNRVYGTAGEHKHRRVTQQGGSGRSSPQGERREGDSRVQRHGWKGGGTQSKEAA